MIKSVQILGRDLDRFFLDASTIQEFYIFCDGICNLANLDVFIGGMGTRGFTWTELERRKRHQGLVAQGRTAEWFHPHADTSLD